MTSVLYFEMPTSKIWLSKMQENKTPKKGKKKKKKIHPTLHKSLRHLSH